MKQNLLFLIILINLNIYSQDTVYFDTHLNREVTLNTANQFSIDSITTNTLYNVDTSMINVRAALPQFRVNIPNTFNKYIVEFKLDHMQGGYTYNVDTNNTLITTNNSSALSQTNFLDTLVISGNSTLDFEISNVSNSGRYQASYRVLHTVDTIFVNSNATTLIEPRVDPLIQIFPNPTSDYIKVKPFKKFHFELFNINGNLINSGILNGILSVKHLPQGLYFLRLNDKVYKFSKK